MRLDTGGLPVSTTLSHSDMLSFESCSPLPPLCHSSCVSKKQNGRVLFSYPICYGEKNGNPSVFDRCRETVHNEQVIYGAIGLLQWSEGPLGFRHEEPIRRTVLSRSKQTYPSGGFTSTGAFPTSSQLVDKVVPPDSTKLFIIARLESSSAPA